MLPRRISTNATYTPTGAFTSKVNILKRSTARDSQGEFLAPDVFASKVWAKIQFIANKYTEKQQQNVTEATHKVIIRYLDHVTSDMLVQNGSKIFNIEAVIDPDDRKVELWMFCYERNDGRVSQ
jgi:SPP1 family predicted phage head-tail adaptor